MMSAVAAARRPRERAARPAARFWRRSAMIALDRFTCFRCNAAATPLLRSDLANAACGERI
jgi:hypothetical protein